jgi:hypothetical protein
MLADSDAPAQQEPAVPATPAPIPVNVEELAVKIAEKIKRVITLASFNPGHFADTHTDAVRSFVQGPGRKILFAYYEGKDLRVQTVAPYTHPSEMMYFVTDLNADEYITEDNFNKRVHYGTVSGNVLKSLLNQLESVFFPALYSYAGWHRSIRTDFLNQFQRFMANLTVCFDFCGDRLV